VSSTQLASKKLTEQIKILYDYVVLIKVKYKVVFLKQSLHHKIRLIF